MKVRFENWTFDLPNSVSSHEGAKITYKRAIAHIKASCDNLERMGIPKKDIVGLFPHGVIYETRGEKCKN